MTFSLKRNSWSEKIIYFLLFCKKIFVIKFFFVFLMVHPCIMHVIYISRAGEPEPGVFGFLEPELLEKKTRERILKTIKQQNN